MERTVESSLTIGCSSEQQTAESKNAMLHYAIVFLIIAIVAGIFGSQELPERLRGLPTYYS